MRDLAHSQPVPKAPSALLLHDLRASSIRASTSIIDRCLTIVGRVRAWTPSYQR